MQDPALANIDGNPGDEIVVATLSAIEVRDATGASLAGWPRPLATFPQGPPVVGELSTASAGLEILIPRGGSLLALFGLSATGPMLAFTGLWGVPYMGTVYGFDRTQAARREP